MKVVDVNGSVINKTRNVDLHFDGISRVSIRCTMSMRALTFEKYITNEQPYSRRIGTTLSITIDGYQGGVLIVILRDFK